MWGRKDKEKKAERRKGGGAASKGGGAGLPFMGIGMPPGGPEESEEALEAELRALQGKSPAGKGKKKTAGGKGSKVMSFQEIDSMMEGLEDVGEGDDEEEDEEGGEEGSGGEDDSDLLAELQEITDERDDDEEEEKAPPTAPPTKSAPTPKKAHPQSPNVTEIAERLVVYEKAIAEAKAKGESSKVRRYTRALDTIKTMHKKAQSGKNVDLDDLPPPIALSGNGGPKSTTGGPKPTTGGPKSTTGGPQQSEITDDELMAWANNDPTPTVAKPKPKPLPQATPPQPKPRPKAPPTTSDGRIDLDDPEFDEFNISEEELAMLAAQMESHKASAAPAAQPQPPKPKPRPSPQTTPPQPKPRPKAPPTTSDGRIDLDDPEFDEFNLSEEDLAVLAAQMESHKTEGEGAKKQKLEGATAMTRAPLHPPRLPPPPPSQSLPVPLISSSSSRPPTKDEVRSVLAERKEHYMAAMKQAKAKNHTAKEREYGKIAVQFSKVLKGFDQGQPVTLTDIPPPPPGFVSRFKFDLSKYQAPPTPKQVTTATPESSVVARETAGEAEARESAPSEASSSIPVPKTVMEALEQRLEKYKSTQQSAEEKGETSRARRMGRIVKQYQEAIKMTKAKKPYDYSELPDPPGYPPIPVPHTPRPIPGPTRSLPPQTSAAMGGSKFMPNPTVSHDQMELLTQRQRELLQATKEAKGKGDREKALHYLRQYKGVEQMVVAADNGLPVDLSQLPPSPYADISKTKPAASVLSHLRPAEEGDKETFERIKKQLQVQIELCESNSKLYKEIKNVGTATQYQNMSRELQKQLLAIEGIQLQGLAPPKFTMETRKFTIVHSHTYISAGQCEVEVVTATSIPRPDGYEEKDLNVYVEIEFPWPGDDPPKVSTDSVKGTACPEFNHTEKFEIERKTLRSVLRILKRNPLRCTIWQRRTLRKHLFIGQALLQLEKFETKTEVKGVLDLLDEKGRKPVGGKMEVVARLREPLSGRDTEEKEEQWLTFHESIAVTSSVQMPRPSPASSSAPQSQNLSLLSPAKIENTTSVEALRIELSLVQSALKSGHKDPATVQKGRQIQARLQIVRQRLQTDPQFRGVYLKQVAKEMQLEQALESKLGRDGKNRQAKILQLRRQAMQQELKSKK